MVGPTHMCSSRAVSAEEVSVCQVGCARFFLRGSVHPEFKMHPGDLVFVSGDRVVYCEGVVKEVSSIAKLLRAVLLLLTLSTPAARFYCCLRSPPQPSASPCLLLPWRRWSFVPPSWRVPPPPRRLALWGTWRKSPRASPCLLLPWKRRWPFLLPPSQRPELRGIDVQRSRAKRAAQGPTCFRPD
jgi:hypothetical protein